MTSLSTRAARALAGLGLALTVAGVSVVGAVSAQASPATSTTTISINPGNVPATATSHDDHSCDQVGESSDRDGWVFVLPGNKGTFKSLTLTFKTTTGETVTLRIPGDGGTIGTGKGTSKAWIQTEPGWTLVAGTAVITGSSANGHFNLTHTCPARGGTESPTPPPATESPTTSPTQPTESPSSDKPTDSPSETPDTSVSPTAAPSSEAPGAGGSDSLPLTGVALTGVIALGVALLGAGIALRMVKRRREVTDAPTAS